MENNRLSHYHSLIVNENWLPDEPSLNKALTEAGEARAEGMKDSGNRTLQSWVGKWADMEYRVRCGKPRAEVGLLWEGTE